MARRSQSSSLGDNPMDPSYLPPHYREEYRLAIDALVEDDVEGYYEFLHGQDVVDFLAQPEIEHIKRTVLAPRMATQPEFSYTESGFADPDGSSDTYWPVHSDLEAPGLDLGWPHLHSFIGSTEVTTLVNPSDPSMPSIKEQARRLIKEATQVIAVVMDMFTDVDIFADLLDAAMRRVPVYILLDELNSHHFISMVTNCKVNLDMIHSMRVRTVAGTTYFCRTGKSFKGQVMNRFLLADCRAVLSGNYSFMWSFEKIHRCIAHLFLGELVTTFDEEFRILYAQSQPLVLEKALVPISGDSGYSTSQYGNNRVPSFRNPRGFLHVESSRHSERSGYSDRMDLDRDMVPFRREDSFRHPQELGPMQNYSKKYSQALEMERSYMDQGRSLMTSMKMEMNAYKRHSYAEGTHENYSSARQFMKHRVMNNLEEMETQSGQFQREQAYHWGGGPGSGHGIYEKIRSRGYQHMEEYSDDPRYPHEMSEHEPPGMGSYNPMLDYMSSNSSKEVKHGSGNMLAPGEGPYGQLTRRQNTGQPYVCQSSPTQLHPPDQKHMFHESSLDRQPQDPTVKQGLRKWRVNSYLSGIEDPPEQGLQQPIGSDAFDEPPQTSEGPLHGPESSLPRFTTREFPKIPSFKTELPRYGKPLLPEASHGPQSGESTSTTAVSKNTTISPATAAEETESREPREISITKHESFRSRMNPLIQRSSRLRSSLIFSSSKLEQHSSLMLKSGLSQKDNQTEEEETDALKTSSIVAQILEKRRSLTREPFEFNLTGKDRDRQKTETKDPPLAEAAKAEEPPKVAAVEEMPKVPVPENPPKITLPVELKPSLSPIPPTDMNDPDSRLRYFKELAAKRKVSKMAADLASRGPEPVTKKPDLSLKSAETVIKIPEISIDPPEPQAKLPEPQPPAPQEVKPVAEVLNKEPQSKSPKPFPSPKFFRKDPSKSSKTPVPRILSCSEDILTDATDTQKSELKKARSLSISGLNTGESVEKLNKIHGSNSSLNILDGGEGKQDTKALDFIKKQTQKLKGLLGQKSDKKGMSATSEEKAAGQTMRTVPEVSEEPAVKTSTELDSTGASTLGESSPPSAPPKTSQTRFQTSTSNVLYSSNLRDDTKVILEQISANSQKNRLEKQAASSTDDSKEEQSGQAAADSAESSSPVGVYQIRNRFQRPQANPEERDNLLKKMESMRKEKKVYSRFELLSNLG
uniref:Family with sequence similarity 83 member Hb n=1 Tax=Lepisosteus oculatus TaxID=7918 RepID=W5ME47_LEPOC